MRVEIQPEKEDRSKPKELISLKQARSQLTALGFWSQDLSAEKASIVPIPETDHARLGFRRVLCDAVGAEEGNNIVTYPILDSAGLWRQIGLSSKLFKEYEDNSELLTSMVRYSLNKRTGHALRFSGHHRGVTSVAEPHGSVFAPERVFDIVANELSGNVENVKLGKRGALEMRFVGEYSTEPPKKRGDLVHAGLVVKMNGSVQVGPYSYRMICSNGMMRMQETLETAGTEGEIAIAVRAACQAHYAAGRELTDHLVHLDEQVFQGNREQMLIRLGHQAGLPANFVAKALERLPELPEAATMYDLINLITQMARMLRNPDKVQERAGTMVHILAQEHCFCDTCGSIVAEN